MGVISDVVCREPSERGRENPGRYTDLDVDLEEPEKREYILCRQCLQIITGPDQRIEMHGAHQHVFANPNGIVYEIGCFREAQGCRYSGFSTEEFSWFVGFSWRVAVCGMCLAHLGWLFSSSGGSFQGLILNKLMFPS